MCIRDRDRTLSWKQNASTSSATSSPTSATASTNFGGIFDYPAKERKLNEVNAALEDPKVWDNPKRAQELGREKRTLEGVVLMLDRLTAELADNAELFEMSRAEGDEAGMLGIEAEAGKLAAEVEKMEFRRMFHHPADTLNAFLDIQAGAGGKLARLGLNAQHAGFVAFG